MSGTHWYYKPTNSARYPGVRARDAFLTEYKLLTANAPSRRTPLRSPEDQKAWLARMSRPTQASTARQDFPRLCFSYKNSYLTWDNRYVWHKMDYMKDSYQCLWSRHGSVKSGCKI